MPNKRTGPDYLKYDPTLQWKKPRGKKKGKELTPEERKKLMKKAYSGL